MTLSERAALLRDAAPSSGLFAGKSWRVAPHPFSLGEDLHERIVELGPRLHAFYQACNLLYHQSVKGRMPAWVHRHLDAGKPADLVEAARDPRFRNDLPGVIRPDLLLSENGFTIVELDSAPGGIGLTAWFQEVYSRVEGRERDGHDRPEEAGRSAQGEPSACRSFLDMLRSWSGGKVSGMAAGALVISEECSAYRPEMEWLAQESLKFQVSGLKLWACRPEELDYRERGVFLHDERLDVVYRFFELFDLSNVANAQRLISLAQSGHVRVTPPFKPQLEEKLWFALFWFPQLAGFWRQELGDRYFRDLQQCIPYTWLLDPAPLPPHAVIPQLGIQDWRQLGGFSQKQRDLILKISGFSDRAWGSRGVFLGSDMPAGEWEKVVVQALEQFEHHPWILQQFARGRVVEHAWYDFEEAKAIPMQGRVRLCPYYFVVGGKVELGGILATLCPPDKKFIHGMKDAIMTLAVKS